MRGSRLVLGTVLVYLFIGCGAGDCGLDYSNVGTSASSGGGCGVPSGAGGCSYGSTPNGSLGQGDFSYVCPSVSGSNHDAWCDLRGALTPSADASYEDTADAAGGMGSLAALGAMDGGAAIVESLFASVPAVAVGAAFQLAYTPVSPASGLSAPAPVLASLGEAVPLGTALAAGEWAGFVVRQGSTVFDYTHVQARPVASLRLSVGPLSGAPPPVAGSTVTLAAMPLAADGTLLAGAMACSFDSTDSSVASVTGGGRAAEVALLRAGQVTVTVDCLGVRAQTTFQVEAQTGPADGGVVDASPGDTSASDNGDDGSGGADGGGVDASPDAPVSDAGEGG
jgi:hypothetical protein